MGKVVSRCCGPCQSVFSAMENELRTDDLARKVVGPGVINPSAHSPNCVERPLHRWCRWITQVRHVGLLIQPPQVLACEAVHGRSIRARAPSMLACAPKSGLGQSELCQVGGRGVWRIMRESLVRKRSSIGGSHGEMSTCCRCLTMPIGRTGRTTGLDRVWADRTARVGTDWYCAEGLACAGADARRWCAVEDGLAPCPSWRWGLRIARKLSLEGVSGGRRVLTSAGGAGSSERELLERVAALLDGRG